MENNNEKNNELNELKEKLEKPMGVMDIMGWIFVLMLIVVVVIPAVFGGKSHEQRRNATDIQSKPKDTYLADIAPVPLPAMPDSCNKSDAGSWNIAYGEYKVKSCIHANDNVCETPKALQTVQITKDGLVLANGKTIALTMESCHVALHSNKMYASATFDARNLSINVLNNGEASILVSMGGYENYNVYEYSAVTK